MKRLLPFCVAITCFITALSAQAPPVKRPLRVGFGLTATRYIGDFTEPDLGYYRYQPGANFSLQSEGTRSLQLQVNAGFGRFTEQYEGFMEAPANVSPVRFVETSFFYGDLRMRYRFLRYARIQPFVSAGAGFLLFTPRDAQGKFLVDAPLTRAEGEVYNTAIPQLPFCAGVQYRLSPQIWLSSEYTYRYTPTDYLDNTGELGGRQGNDALHSIQFALHIALARTREVPPPPPPPAPPFDRRLEAATPATLQYLPMPPVAMPQYDPASLRPDFEPVPDAATLDSLFASSGANLAEAALEAWRGGRVIFYRPQPGETYEDLYLRFRAPERIVREMNSLEGEDLPWGRELMLPDLRLVQDVDATGIIEPGASQWVQAEMEALQRKKYIYYLVKEGDQIERIAARFQVRIPTLKRLNFLRENHLYVGSYLRLPDLGIPAE